jgi:hypothetical protein
MTTAIVKRDSEIISDSALHNLNDRQFAEYVGG